MPAPTPERCFGLQTKMQIWQFFWCYHSIMEAGSKEATGPPRAVQHDFANGDADGLRVAFTS